ncbi:MAG: lysophospholipid acyltransferase family protein [Planctomycetota bacterium]
MSEPTPSVAAPSLAGAPPSPEAPASSPEPTKPRRKSSLRRRIRKAFSKRLIRLLALIIPPIYQLGMWLVYKTSRVEHENTDLLWILRERYGGMIGIMWHQDVFMVAYSFRQYEGHTLASTSDFGTIISGMLKNNGFVTFRGGSTAARSRKRDVLGPMIEHMRNGPAVCYGITCDGSRGPAYRLKRGSVVIAHEARKPMIVARTWCKWRIPLPGWDHAYIPLPFNHIRQTFAGPYFVPAEADDPAVLEAFRLEMEDELLNLTWYVHGEVDRAFPKEPRFGFPPGWRPRWSGLPRLDLEAPEEHPAREQVGKRPVRARAQREQREAIARASAKDPAVAVLLANAPHPPEEREPGEPAQPGA